jgi:hypothetical protein
MNFDLLASTAGYLPLLAVALAAIGVVLLIGSLLALRRARLWRFALRIVLAGVLLALAAFTAGLHGYTRLTHEELAAQISVRPIGAQRFEATFRFANGRVAIYQLAGDEIYVDAHILKWKPVAHLLGLHTLWSLDRVAGRYRSLEQERSAERTVHPVAAEPFVDLFALRRRFDALAPLYDAEYGSASFVAADKPAELELRVSTSGLLIRAADQKR